MIRDCERCRSFADLDVIFVQSVSSVSCDRLGFPRKLRLDSAWPRGRRDNQDKFLQHIEDGLEVGKHLGMEQDWASAWGEGGDY